MQHSSTTTCTCAQTRASRMDCSYFHTHMHSYLDSVCRLVSHEEAMRVQFFTEFQFKQSCRILKRLYLGISVPQALPDFCIWFNNYLLLLLLNHEKNKVGSSFINIFVFQLNTIQYSPLSTKKKGNWKLKKIKKMVSSWLDLATARTLLHSKAG